MTQPSTGSASVKPAQTKNSLATAGMILGILSLGLFCICSLVRFCMPGAGFIVVVCFYLSVPAAVVGVIFSAIGLKRAKVRGIGAGFAKIGLILCIFAFAADIAFVVREVVAFRAAMNEEFQKQWDSIRGNS